MDDLLTILRAAGDPTRLRLLLLLQQAELTVSEMVQIVGQSQPRVSRHLKLLCDAGLLLRFKEGSWVFYRAAEKGLGAEFAREVARLAGEGEQAALEADRRRLGAVREAHAAVAQEFFKANAAQWERLRSLHAPEKDVESAIVSLLDAPETMLDVGTGTGRMLELLSPHIRRGVGIDVSPEMLAIARDRLERSSARNCQVRLGDARRLPFADGSGEDGFDAVLIHQVLHYLEDPQTVVVEAARILRGGGRMVIADFAPHDLEFLRTELAHRRLGFSDREVHGWFQAAGLKVTTAQSIAPDVSAKLTVRIWVAQNQSARQPKRTREAA